MLLVAVARTDSLAPTLALAGKAAALDMKAGAKTAGDGKGSAESKVGEKKHLGDTGAPVGTPKVEGAEAQVRDLDLSVIHQKLLQGCYASGAEVEADINKVLQTALEKESAAPSKSSAGAHFLEALATCRSFPGLPQGEPARSEACHDLQCHFDSSKSKAKGVPYWYNKRNGGTTWN